MDRQLCMYAIYYDLPYSFLQGLKNTSQILVLTFWKNIYLIQMILKLSYNVWINYK